MEKKKIKRASYGSMGPAKMVSMRMPIDLIEKLDRASKRLGISKNTIICEACLEKLSRDK